MAIVSDRGLEAAIAQLEQIKEITEGHSIILTKP